MTNQQNEYSNIFSNFKFPDIVNPISYNSDSPNLTKYMKRLANDDIFT